METKNLRGVRQYKLDSSALLEMKYYVVERPMNGSENYYGIEISQQKTKAGLPDSIEYKRLLLSESKEWVEEVIDQFIGNGVTPSTMAYIIDDLMAIPC